MSGNDAETLSAEQARETQSGQGSFVHAHREVTDFLVVACSLIFLFRTFVTEPFQIPTGSMGPSLLGRHKTFICPRCRMTTTVSSSNEIDLSRNVQIHRIVSAQCSNCQKLVDVNDVPSQPGDRVIVLKDPFDAYRRFEVIVFKHPVRTDEYFIKRIVGLPGETVRIFRGEIERKSGRNDWLVCRKSPAQALQLAQSVYDDRFARFSDEAPRRWRSRPPQSWLRTGNEYRCRSDQPARLVYQHLTDDRIEPRLITDDVAYNSGLNESQTANRWAYRQVGGHPVSDLHLELTVKPDRAARSVSITLVDGYDRFTWTYKPQQHRHELSRGDEVLETYIDGAAPSQARYRLAKVDQQLMLWRDGELLVCREYESNPALPPGPHETDLQPVIITVEGAGTVVSDLVLLRDIYYTRQSQTLDYFPPVDREALPDWLGDPSAWRRLRQRKPPKEPWTLGSKEYMVLGDNSPQSNDSRHWRTGAALHKRMILGRAITPPWWHVRRQP